MSPGADRSTPSAPGIVDVTGKGRRPGKRDTRAEIVAAARASFADVGYDRSSLRAIATRAGVDPSLVHHYFAGGKAELFAAAMQDEPDAGMILDRVATGLGRPMPSGEPVGGESVGGDPPGHGAMIVANFIRLWDDADQASSPGQFVSFVQAAASSPESATGVREFIVDRIWSNLDDGDRSPEDLARRRALIASQLMGLAFARYVLRLEAIVDATPDQLGAWAGANVDRYDRGPLD
jgi:AcrR family transcriptional regulator